MVDHRTPMMERLRGYTPRKVVAIEPEAEGRITRSVGLTLEAVGLNVSVGRQCEVIAADNRRIEAEVVGFAGDKVFLMPIKRVEGLQPGARVIPIASQQGMRIGPQLLGRVVNGIGQPLDSKGPLIGD
jgi:flagellum-specific ATP synthase